MEITITIPDEKVDELQTYFLYNHPIPVNEETGEPEYTILQWFKKWLYRQVVNAYKSGKKRKKWDEFQVTYELNE